MPGQLVHTNEILVLLGDNYFVERSAYQAVEIVSRRLKGELFVPVTFPSLTLYFRGLNHIPLFFFLFSVKVLLRCTCWCVAELDKTIESLQKQRELLSPRADFTSEILKMTQVSAHHGVVGDGMGMGEWGCSLTNEARGKRFEEGMFVFSHWEMKGGTVKGLLCN